MKRKTKEKIIWAVVCLMWAIIGALIGIGFLGTLGLWPERWKF